jgi:hypothetical protein
VFASLAFCSYAKAEVLSSRYSVNLNGVHIGDAIFHATLDAKRYKIIVSADVGMLLNSTRVQGEATGLRAGAKLTPEYFHLVTSDGQESAVNFAAPSEKGAKANPALRGVFDPLSALLVASLGPIAVAGAPCNKVIPVLMNRARFDVSLHPAPGNEDHEPRIITCRADFTAVVTPGGASAGMQKIHWEVGFQKVTKYQLWLVEQLSLPTDMGTVTIERVETAISAS